jgi:hypothetical protein
MSVAFIIMMENYNYSRLSELWFIEMVIGKVGEIHCAKKSDMDKNIMP